MLARDTLPLTLMMFRAMLPAPLRRRRFAAFTLMTPMRLRHDTIRDDMPCFIISPCRYDYATMLARVAAASEYMPPYAMLLYATLLRAII